MLLAFPLMGQDQAAEGTRFDDTRLYYKKEQSGGLVLHTNGWGLNYRHGLRKGAFNMTLFSGELVGMKHPKEYKTFNPYYDETKGYVFGKKNVLVLARGIVGKQRIMYSKETKKGVRVSTVYAGGLNLGMLKPVYLEITKPGERQTNTIVTERYDEEVHTIDKIYGRAPVLRGLDELSVSPGLHLRVAANFEYAPLDELIKALEVGFAADGFLTPVPMMAFIDNKQVFLTFYLNWQVGKKSY